MLYGSSAPSKIVPDLGHLQETLLIPLYARARDATRRHPVLHDERAAALVDSLEYDFWVRWPLAAGLRTSIGHPRRMGAPVHDSAPRRNGRRTRPRAQHPVRSARHPHGPGGAP